MAGFEYDTIVSFLEKFHSIHISLSTLKRRLRDCGLKRRDPADLNQNGVRENNQRRVGWPKLHVWIRGYICGIHFASNVAFVFPEVQCKAY